MGRLSDGVWAEPPMEPGWKNSIERFGDCSKCSTWDVIIDYGMCKACLDEDEE